MTAREERKRLFVLIHYLGCEVAGSSVYTGCGEEGFSGHALGDWRAASFPLVLLPPVLVTMRFAPALLTEERLLPAIATFPLICATCISCRGLRIRRTHELVLASSPGIRDPTIPCSAVALNPHTNAHGAPLLKQTGQHNEHSLRFSLSASG
jgi:hypothetical protein